MNDISERLTVHCPDREAAQYLAAFVADHQVGDATVRVVLRLPMSIFVDRRSLVDRRVVATLYPLQSMSDPHPTYSVTWSRDGDPFPEFNGAIAVEKSSHDDCFGLIVSGHYEPPFGAPDAPFDVELGRRIGRASARDLLRSIADHIENARAHNAAARAGYSTVTLFHGRRGCAADNANERIS